MDFLRPARVQAVDILANHLRRAVLETAVSIQPRDKEEPVAHAPRSLSVLLDAGKQQIQVLEQVAVVETDHRQVGGDAETGPYVGQLDLNQFHGEIYVFTSGEELTKCLHERS